MAISQTTKLPPRVFTSSFSEKLSDNDFEIIEETVNSKLTQEKNSKFATAKCEFDGNIGQSNPSSISELIREYVESKESKLKSQDFISLQKWIGYVTSIGKSNFEAKLIDLNSDGTYEIGEFEIKEVSPGDMELLTLGAAFYWSIGYSNNGYQVEKKSVIRFQRIKSWTEDEYDLAIDKACEMYDFLGGAKL